MKTIKILLSLALTALLPLGAHADAWYRLKHQASGLYVQFPASPTGNPTLEGQGTVLRLRMANEGAVLQSTEGQFLSANSNGWSINTTPDVAKAMSLQLSPLADGTATLRYRNGTGLGTDAATQGGKLFYNKSRRAKNSFFVLEPAAAQPAAEAALGSAPTISVREQLQGEQLTMTAKGDLHLFGTTDVLKDAGINLQSEEAWVIMDHIRPQECVDKYLQFVKVLGETAVLNQNVRVAVYKDGCAIIPHSNRYQAFLGYYEANRQGSTISLSVGTFNNLGEQANEMNSFVLKRGYMATLSSNADGSGYSRVYVADHSDIVVDQLPAALAGRVSSIVIRRWNYNNKKGWGSTGNNTGEANTVRANWIYSWSAGYSSGNNAEYVPHKSHIYWPGWSEINGKSGSNHVLGYNEPEHSEQHSDQCGTTISAWTAFQHSDEFLAGGMRIGSPSPTDASWLTEYCGYLDGYARRCDFVAYHAYWTGDIASWKSQLEAIHNNTKRPIWITEMEYGASWLSPGYSDVNTAKGKYEQIFNLLETLDFVEAYFPYNTDLWYNRMIYEQGGLTPAGQVYRDWDSDFAYKSWEQLTPLWWQPSASTPSLRVALSTDAQNTVFMTQNGNLDYTQTLYVERQNPETRAWEVIITETKRPSFDNKENTYALSRGEHPFDLENDLFRVRVVLNNGKEVVSDPVSGALVQNGNITTSSKSTVPHWTCERHAQNGNTKDTGNTYLEVWDAKAANIRFKYYQILGNLPAGYYSLEAQCFNSANGVEGDSVNGAVVLFAENIKSGLEYTAPVLRETTIDDSLTLSIPYIYVGAGDTLCVGIRNIAAMTARWAGADNFRLTYLGRAATDLTREACAWAHETTDSLLQSCRLNGVQNQLNRYAASTSNSSLMFQNMMRGVRVAETERFVQAAEGTEPVDLTSLLVNPNAGAADAYGWTATNVSFDAANASDGTTSGNSYFNYWSSNSYTSTMSQDLRHLPAGDYQLRLLYRASDKAQLTLSAEANGKSLATIPLPGRGETTVSGEPYVKGWMLSEPLLFTLPMNQTLTIRFNCEGGAGAWWSADDFQLRYASPVVSTAIALPAEVKRQTPDFKLNGQQATGNHRGIVVRQGGKYINR